MIILLVGIGLSLTLANDGRFFSAFGPTLFMALNFAFFTTIGYYFYQNKTNYTGFVYFSIMVLTIFVFYRIDPYLYTINFITLIYTISILFLYAKHKNLSILTCIFAPLFLIQRLITTKNALSFKINTDLNLKSKILQDLKKSIISIFLSIIVLAIIVPLLAASNSDFRDLIVNIFSSELIKKIFEFLFSSPFIWIGRAIYVFLFTTFTCKLISFLDSKEPTEDLLEEIEKGESKFEKQIENFVSLPKVLSIIVIAVFIILQTKLYVEVYSMDLATMKALGYSHSGLTNDVFFQLALTSAVICGLLYLSKNIFKGYEKYIDFILLIEISILTYFAFDSDLAYIKEWGFTLKRLYGMAFITGLIGTIGIMAWYFLSKKSRMDVIKASLANILFVIFLINLINFDYIIYNYYPANVPAGKDYRYLMDLSPDADQYIGLLNELEEKIPAANNCKSPLYSDYSRLLSEIAYQQQKLEKMRFSTFNLSGYAAYSKIKYVDTFNRHDEWFEKCEEEKKRNKVINEQIFKIPDVIDQKSINQKSKEPVFIEMSKINIKIKNLPSDFDTGFVRIDKYPGNKSLGDFNIKNGMIEAYLEEGVYDMSLSKGTNYGFSTKVSVIVSQKNLQDGKLELNPFSADKK